MNSLPDFPNHTSARSTATLTTPSLTETDVKASESQGDSFMQAMDALIEASTPELNDIQKIPTPEDASETVEIAQTDEVDLTKKSEEVDASEDISSLPFDLTEPDKSSSPINPLNLLTSKSSSLGQSFLPTQANSSDPLARQDIQTVSSDSRINMPIKTEPREVKHVTINTQNLEALESDTRQKHSALVTVEPELKTIIPTEVRNLPAQSAPQSASHENTPQIDGILEKTMRFDTRLVTNSITPIQQKIQTDNLASNSLYATSVVTNNGPTNTTKISRPATLASTLPVAADPSKLAKTVELEQFKPLSEAPFVDIRHPAVHTAPPALLTQATPRVFAAHNTSNISDALITLRESGGQIDVSLSPDDLGRLNIKVDHTSNGTQITLAAERPETQEMMRRQIEQLQTQLKNMGFENLSFSFGQNQNERTFDDQTATQDGYMSAIQSEQTTPAITLTPSVSGLDIRI